MDETTRSIIDRITIVNPQPVRIYSGHVCKVFYDCIQLSPNDLARLAAQTIGHLHEGAFDLALGIAYSGIFFAAAIAGGRQIAILQKDGLVCGPSLTDKTIIIVDDVVHSGRHLFNAERIASSAGARVAGYACIVDRSNSKVGTPEKPLWSAFQTTMG